MEFFQQGPLYKAVGVSSGKANGTVRVIPKGGHTARFNTGDILVTEMTDPSMVMLMSKASAIITNTGGMTCHAAIVSREMGIPCVVATKDATQTLKDGQTVLVDGDTGEVFLIRQQ